MWLRKLDTASTGDPLVLVVVEGSDRRTLVLEHFPFTVGRRTDRDLVMADPRVSREHAQFIREPDGTYIVDQSSRHGTFVNGERVNRRKLARNDRVEFGVQGAAYALFSPDRSPSSAAQQFLSQFSTWKPATGAGSDLEMLNVFLEAARKLNTSGVLDDVLHTLLEAALRLTHAERGFVFLRHPDGELRLAAGRDKKGESINDDSTISRSVLRDAAKSASEFLVTDTDDTDKLAGRESVVAHNLHSVICIPLRKTVIQDKVREETKPGESDVQGVLYLDAHFLSGKLSSVSHDILRTIANGAATLVENAALVQAEDAAKRYRQELSIAAEIQQRLMTVTVPEVPFAKVNAVSYACKDIGGDFFDLVYTDGGLSLIVADVSGKGVSAAVVASILQGMLYSQLARDSSLPEMIAAVNRFLCDKVGGQPVGKRGDGTDELRTRASASDFRRFHHQARRGQSARGIGSGRGVPGHASATEARRPSAVGDRRRHGSRGCGGRILWHGAAGKLRQRRVRRNRAGGHRFSWRYGVDRRLHDYRDDLSRAGVKSARKGPRKAF
jgi:hypothetical protein